MEHLVRAPIRPTHIDALVVFARVLKTKLPVKIAILVTGLLSGIILMEEMPVLIIILIMTNVLLATKFGPLVSDTMQEFTIRLLRVLLNTAKTISPVTDLIRYVFCDTSLPCSKLVA